MEAVDVVLVYLLISVDIDHRYQDPRERREWWRIVILVHCVLESGISAAYEAVWSKKVERLIALVTCFLFLHMEGRIVGGRSFSHSVASHT